MRDVIPSIEDLSEKSIIEAIKKFTLKNGNSGRGLLLKRLKLQIEEKEKMCTKSDQLLDKTYRVIDGMKNEIDKLMMDIGSIKSDLYREFYD